MKPNSKYEFNKEICFVERPYSLVLIPQQTFEAQPGAEPTEQAGRHGNPVIRRQRQSLAGRPAPSYPENEVGGEHGPFSGFSGRFQTPVERVPGALQGRLEPGPGRRHPLTRHRDCDHPGHIDPHPARDVSFQVGVRVQIPTWRRAHAAIGRRRATTNLSFSKILHDYFDDV